MKTIDIKEVQEMQKKEFAGIPSLYNKYFIDSKTAIIHFGVNETITCKGSDFKHTLAMLRREGHGLFDVEFYDCKDIDLEYCDKPCELAFRVYL